MKKSIYALILCGISLLLSSFSAPGYVPSVLEQTYTTVALQDLSSLTAYSLVTDHQGFVWIATRNGVDRYDGIAIHHYRLGNSKMRTMRSGLTTTVYCDEQGRLWAFTERSIIYMYDPKEDSFVEVFNMPEYQLWGSSQALYCKGNTLIVGATDGITIFNISTRTVEHRLCPDEDIHVITAYNDNELFFGCDRGIGILNIAEQKIDFHNDWIDAVPKAFYYCTKEKRLWVGSNGKGLFIVDPKNPKNVIHQRNTDGLIITAIKAAQGDKEMLVGVDGGGVYACPVVTDGSDQLQLLASDIHSAPYHLQTSGVRDIMVDDGHIWVASFRGGVTMLKPGSSVTTLNVTDIKTPSDNFAFGVDVASDGRYWVAFNHAIGSFAPDGSDPKMALVIKEANFLTVRVASDGTVWAGGFNTGTYHIFPGTGKKEFYPTVVDQPILDCVYDIFEDSHGDIWIGGLNIQLTRMHQLPDKSYEKTHYPITLINSIAQLDDNTIAASTTDGFSTINIQTGEIRKYLEDESSFEGTNYICDARSRHGKELWLATAGAGLLCYDFVADSLITFGLDEGLPSLELRGMSLVNDSILYISTENSGLFVFDCGLRRYERCLKTNDDLPINEFYQNSATVTHEGGLLFGGDNGVVTLTSTDMHTDLRKFDIVLESKDYRPVSVRHILVDGEEVRTVDLLLTTTDIYHQKEYIFYYKMKGIEDDWVLVDNSRRIRFAHLPAGTYELEIHAVGAANQVSGRIITIEVATTIWTARNMLFVSILILLASAVMLYLAYKKKKN